MKDTWLCQKCHELRCRCRPRPVGVFRLFTRFILRTNRLDSSMSRNRLPYFRTGEKDLFQRRASAFYQRSTQPTSKSSPAWEQKE